MPTGSTPGSSSGRKPARRFPLIQINLIEISASQARKVTCPVDASILIGASSSPPGRSAMVVDVSDGVGLDVSVAVGLGVSVGVSVSVGVREIVGVAVSIGVFVADNV